MANGSSSGGPMQLGQTLGQIASIWSEPETSPVQYWADFDRYFNPTARSFRRFTKRDGEQEQLYNQYRDAILGSQAEAQANARIGQDYIKNLFANQPNQFANYQQVGDYLYGKLDSFSNALKDSGLRDMNARLAGLGIRPGSTGYDRLLNATRITNNLAPAFANTTNAIGRDYSALAGNDLSQTLMRLGLVQGDALNQAMDRAFARPLNVANVRLGQLGANNQLVGDMLRNQVANVAGWETKEGSDLAKWLATAGALTSGIDSIGNWAINTYTGGLGGGMGGMGGGGGAGGLGGIMSMFGGGGGSGAQPMYPVQNPYQNPYQYVPYGGAGGSLGYGTPLGDYNLNPNIAGVV